MALYLRAVQARSEYRADFLIGCGTAVLGQLAALSFYWIVFTKIDLLGGWPPAGVLFLFGATAMSLAVSELCFNGIWQLPVYIAGGELDRLLVYPVRRLWFLLISRPELHALGNLVSGAIVIGLSFRLAPPPAVAYLLLPVWVVSGAIIYTSALVLLGCLTFVVVGPGIHHYSIAHHLLQATRYPLKIYPRWLHLVLLFVFPMGAANFLPGSWLQGEASLFAAVAGPPIAASLSALVASLTFGRALRYYESTGS